LIRDCYRYQSTLLRDRPCRRRFKNEATNDLATSPDEKLQLLARKTHVFGAPANRTEVYVPVGFNPPGSAFNEASVKLTAPKMEQCNEFVTRTREDLLGR